MLYVKPLSADGLISRFCVARTGDPADILLVNKEPQEELVNNRNAQDAAIQDPMPGSQTRDLESFYSDEPFRTLG